MAFRCRSKVKDTSSSETSIGNDAESWYDKGHSLYAQGKYDEAITDFDKAIEIYPQYAKAWNIKADSLNVVGRHGDTIKAADMAIVLDPKLSSPWAHKACALRYQGRYEEAANGDRQGHRDRSTLCGGLV